MNNIMNENILSSRRIIYIFKERSARANAVCKHILKFNPDIIIKEIIDFTELEDIDIHKADSRNYFFILNESGIQSYYNFIQLSKSMEDRENYYKLKNAVFPTKMQLLLETSKLYCREFLERIGMEYLNPEYKVINKTTNLNNINFFNKVIKADGLMGGKGVFVYDDHYKTNREAIGIVKKLLETNECVLLEDKLVGEEFSCITLSWKGVITHFPLVKDFKRLENGDKGLNTGGMGTITFAGGNMPFLNASELEHCKSINETVIIETHYRGFLYGSFIKTSNNEIKLIEYNIRLGDSEGVNILELLDSNLILHLDEPLKNPLLINLQDNTYFRYMVPKTYSRNIYNNQSNQTNQTNQSNQTNQTYYLVDNTIPPDRFYLADSNLIYKTEHTDDSGGIEARIEARNCGGLYSIGKSRTCGVLSRDKNVYLLITENDRLVSLIHGNLHYRTDIGLKMIEINNYDSINNKILVNPDLNQMNYLGHLDNYNHIITDVKKLIDLHNEEVSSFNPSLSILGKIGDFANSVQFGSNRIICSIDGAGTKTKFLENHPKRFEILGKDIVIHNLNDMFCNNGRPIALLDYYGCDKLDKQEFAQFIDGAISICREYGIALIGGETAEMKGIFQIGEVEVLGILLGILEEGKNCENGKYIETGHIIYGLESNGAHTNGFTKLREIESRGNMPDYIKEFFSQPHKCYIPIINYLEEIINTHNIKIKGKAHITGGGFQDNIERILPDGLDLELETWELNNEWQWLIENTGMDWNEFIRVFNAGWGFCIIIDKELPIHILEEIAQKGYGKIKKIGNIINKQI